MTGITTIVEQLTGASRIPENARPRTTKPGPRDGGHCADRVQSATARLLSWCADGTWRSVEDTAAHAGVSASFVRKTAPILVDDGVFEERDCKWSHGWRVEYRRAR